MSSENTDKTANMKRHDPRRLFRRIDVRLTAWFSLVFLITSVALFGLTMWNLYRTLLNEDRAALKARVISAWAQFQAAPSEQVGITQLVSDIQRESLGLGDRPYFVRIATSDNRNVFVRIPLVDWRVAFDLSQIFDGNTPHANGFMTLPSEVLGYELEVIGYPLSDNYVIQIGMDTEARVQVLRIFRGSFLVTFMVLFGVSVLGGLLFTSRSLRPIGSLNETITSIIETGKLDQRIPRVGGGDDLDDLVRSFNHMLDRVEQLVRGMRDALDAVAHDLRTPMTRLRSNAEVALARPNDGHAHAEALGVALEESDQILRMLNSMMDISEAEAGAMKLRLERVDVERLVAEVVDVYGLVAEEAGISVKTSVAESLAVNADPGRLRQAIGNLVDNAVKYGRAGSEVAVTVRSARQEISDPAGHEFVEVSVRNEGAGITAEEVPHIWERLYRGGEGRKSAGLGLGLTLVRAIVEAHGGRVEVVSEPGSFAEFRILLPVSDEHHPSSEEPDSRQTTPPSNQPL